MLPQWRQLGPGGRHGVVRRGGGARRSGFIAAFVAGMAYRRDLAAARAARDVPRPEVGNILAAVTWLGFGALAVSRVWSDITWRVVVYALLSLTLVRMVPVALALAGTGARQPTVAFMGWFGPRGLASVVFGLLALEAGVPDLDRSSPRSWSRSP